MKRLFEHSFVIFLFLSSFTHGQNFESKPFITMTGYNHDLYLLSDFPGTDSYISWINRRDSVYTLYFSKLDLLLENPIKVSEDSSLICNPQLSYNRFGEGIRVAWQRKVNGVWQITSKNYNGNTLDTLKVLCDSIKNDPQITMNTNRIVWIDKGKLIIREFYPQLSNKLIVDSGNCAAPDLVSIDHINSPKIIYEKEIADNIEIIRASRNLYLSTDWKFDTLSLGGINTNPKFGFFNGVVFQNFYGTVNKIIYSALSSETWDTTGNISCNYSNPSLFTYDIPTSNDKNDTPYFIVFENDSIKDNKEIFIKTFMFGAVRKHINISNLEGDDSNPQLSYFSSGESLYVAILWTNINKEKSSIWMAAEQFKPRWTSVEDELSISKTFKLYQNYPNPFNPITTIEYTISSNTVIPVSSNDENRNLSGQKISHLSSQIRNDRVRVKLVVYGLLGREIETLVNKQQRPGTYKVEFNASKYPSGVYIYSLSAGDYKSSRKMLLVK